MAAMIGEAGATPPKLDMFAECGTWVSLIAYVYAHDMII